MDWLQQLALWAQPFITGFLSHYPVAATVLAAMATARVIMKPIFSVLPQLVAETPWQWDNELYQKVLASPIYKVAAWVFDYMLSIKLPAQPKPAAPAAAPQAQPAA